MRNIKYRFLGGLLAVTLCGAVIIPTTIVSASATEGKDIAFDRKKGNCLACHQIEGGESPGNLGPLLANMKMRYSDKAQLRAKIWDATTTNSATAMPPFGRHQLISDQEIDQVVDFIWSK